MNVRNALKQIFSYECPICNEKHAIKINSLEYGGFGMFSMETQCIKCNNISDIFADMRSIFGAVDNKLENWKKLDNSMYNIIHNARPYSFGNSSLSYEDNHFYWIRTVNNDNFINEYHIYAIKIELDFDYHIKSE